MKIIGETNESLSSLSKQEFRDLTRSLGKSLTDKEFDQKCQEFQEIKRRKEMN